VSRLWWSRQKARATRAALWPASGGMGRLGDGGVDGVDDDGDACEGWAPGHG